MQGNARDEDKGKGDRVLTLTVAETKESFFSLRVGGRKLRRRSAGEVGTCLVFSELCVPVMGKRFLVGGGGGGWGGGGGGGKKRGARFVAQGRRGSITPRALKGVFDS